MSTTTIRIEPELKGRLAGVAAASGQAPHALIVEAIERAVADKEAELELLAMAQKRWSRFLRDGESLDWEVVKRELLDKVASSASPPAKRTSRRKAAPRR
jgi:predicted transcriptional regulator